MAVRKIPLENGGYIKFENDEEYYAYLAEQEAFRQREAYLRQQEEALRQKQEKETMKSILQLTAFVGLVIGAGILLVFLLL